MVAQMDCSVSLVVGLEIKVRQMEEIHMEEKHIEFHGENSLLLLKERLVEAERLRERSERRRQRFKDILGRNWVGEEDIQERLERLLAQRERLVAAAVWLRSEIWRTRLQTEILTF